MQYGSAGHHVCVVDVNDTTGNQVSSLINDSGGEAFFVHCDIADQKSVESLVKSISDKWQQLDVLVNNAGVAGGGLLEYESMEQWKWVMDINFMGHVRMTKELMPLIKLSSDPERAVIYTASQAAITASAGMASYSASKAAIVSFAETMYLELAPSGIHVAVICPGFFKTKLNESMRTEQPGLTETIHKLIQDSGVSAEEIATIVINEVADKKFMIITHQEGRDRYQLKNSMPMEEYLKLVLKQEERW